MGACFLFPFQNEYDQNAGYMLKQTVFGSFYHPFQDGYKSSIIQILFPWLVQGGYLKGTSSVYGIADIKREGRSSDYAVSEIKREMQFSPSVLYE